MKRKISILMTMLLAVVMTANAAPDITFSGDTMIITAKANGDLASRHFTQQQMQWQNIKVVTANGYRLSAADVNNLLGSNWDTPPFSRMRDLDLSLADLANNNDIQQLHNSNKLCGGALLGTLVLPESLTSFPTGALSASTCTWTKIVFPDATKPANAGTTAIAQGAFTGCKSIRSLVIGTSVRSIGANAFDGCTNMTSLDLLYGVTRIDANAFYGCTGLERVILPESLTEIGPNAFNACSNMNSIRFPNSLKYIRHDAFANCTKLTRIIIPESVELIEYGAFQNPYITDVYVLGTNTKCANQAFQPTSMTYGAYSYSGPGNGETVELTAFTTSTGVYTRFHYPQEAYNKYVNYFTRVVGTPAFYTSPYSGNPELNHWVFDPDGNKLPVHHSGYFDNPYSTNYGGDYAGWWNFKLTGKIKGVYTDERLTDGKWYSVCFPFDLSAKQIGEAFGNATEVCEFSGAHIRQNEYGRDYLRLEFKRPVSEMKAHHPYMIHPGLHNAEYNILVDVVIDPDTDGDQYARKLQAESVTLYDEKGNKYTFIGNHTTGALVPKFSYYYYSGNETDKWANAFYKAMRTDVVFTPHTAVVQLERDNGISGAKAMTAFFTEESNLQGTTTLINDIGTTPSKEQTDCRVYDVYGHVVRQNTQGISTLPAGIYIVNGKKFIIK